MPLLRTHRERQALLRVWHRVLKPIRGWYIIMMVGLTQCVTAIGAQGGEPWTKGRRLGLCRGRGYADCG